MLSQEQQNELEKMQTALGLDNQMTEEEKEKWLKLKKATWLKTIRTACIVWLGIVIVGIVIALSLFSVAVRS